MSTLPAASRKLEKRRALRRYWPLYLFLIPSLAYIVVFCYIPMGGLYMAFSNFKPSKGLFGSTYVGFQHFERFFKLYQFKSLILNTFRLAAYGLVAGFPVPVLLALLLHYSPFYGLKKTVQTVTYMPHFISTVVMVGMIDLFFAPTDGLFANMLHGLGWLDGSLRTLLSEKAFPHLYVWTGIWQGMGFSSVIYIAALSGVDPALHESAMIDGASKLQRIWYIDLPHLSPTMVILLILNCGNLLYVGYEKVYMMQNTLNLPVSEVLSTYVWKIGLVKMQYSFSTAVNLFNSLVSVILIVTVNRIVKLLGSDGLM